MVPIAALLLALAASPEIACPADCPPQPGWQTALGGQSDDLIRRLLSLPGGDMLVAGSSASSDGIRTNGVRGQFDYWIVRVDRQGAVLSQLGYGGPQSDRLADLQPLSDGGWILAGDSQSDVGGDKTAPRHGNQGNDYWILRTDAQGAVVWDKSFGGPNPETCAAVRIADNGDLLVGGTSSSGAEGNKTAPNQNPDGLGQDFWLLRLDADGEILWDRTYGGTSYDVMEVMLPGADGSFYLAGSSSSGADGNKTAEGLGGTDFWVVRIDANGDPLWDRAYGSEEHDRLTSAIVMADGGLLLAGESPPDPPVPGAFDAPNDYLLMRLDAAGDVIWQRHYGGISNEQSPSIFPVNDGGWIVAGQSASFPAGEKSSPWFGSFDVWLLRLDAEGEVRWQQTLGGTDIDYSGSLLTLEDGALVVGMTSYSGLSGNRTAPPLGAGDIWLVELPAPPSDDCDQDGVTDAQDECAETPAGAVVNAAGCSLDQLCPCDFLWIDHSNYVACVVTEAASFAAAGLITQQEREAIVQEAGNANCPKSGPAALIFGLRNFALGDATLEIEDPEYGPMRVNTSASLEPNGLAVELGEAEGGVFLGLDAPIWGEYDHNWSLTGQAFGSVAGASNALLATLIATKPYYETYPVSVDFTPLGAESLTYQIFRGPHLVASETTAGPTGRIQINSQPLLGPRANPLWRMPDGSVGALIEFTQRLTEDDFERMNILIPGASASGDRVFVRANHLPHPVDFVSRTTVLARGGLRAFDLVDERLGQFGNRHRALGRTVFDATVARLALRPEDPFGELTSSVLVELDAADGIEIDLEPLSPPRSNDLFTVELAGCFEEDRQDIAGFHMRHRGGSVELILGTGFVALEHGLRLQAFTDGHPGEAVTLHNDRAAGWVDLAEGEAGPSLTGVGYRQSFRRDALALCVRFQEVLMLNLGDGVSLEGNQFQIVPMGHHAELPRLDTVILSGSGLETWAISGERVDEAAPDLNIGHVADTIFLNWPVRAAPYVLEAAPSPEGPFEDLDYETEMAGGRYHTTVPEGVHSRRYFRLRRQE